MTNLCNATKKNINNSIDAEKNLLFDKSVICPACQTHFKSRTVKVNAPRIDRKDSDFFITYKGINTYFYDVWICNNCGYSALKVDFEKLNSKQIEFILQYIKPKWKPKIYPETYDVNIALDRYKLALITASIIKKKPSTKGMICLKIAWMYRLLENKNMENSFLEKALLSFENAYSNEILPVYGMQKANLLYMIGELNRRLGNYENALRNFSLVLIDEIASHRLKELTRDMRDLIRDAQAMQNESN
ncbi:MAG: DUF2225 domain-containing protein [Sarcina sp.]